MKEEEIKAQAKKIMDEFIRALEKVNVDEKVGFESDPDTRLPKDGKKSPSFKKQLLENAPKSNGDCIIAEKKGW